MLKGLRIGTKMTIAFAIILAGLVAIGIYGSLSLSDIAQKDTRLYQNNLVGMDHISDTTIAYYNLRVKILKTVHENFTAAGAKELKDTITTSMTTLNQKLSELEKQATAANTKQDIDTVKNLEAEFANYEQIANKIVDQITANDQSSAMKSLSEAAKLAADIATIIDNMTNNSAETGKSVAEGNSAASSTAIIIMIAVAASVLLLAVLIAFFVTRGIIKPITKVAKAAESIASGNTDVQIDVKSKDETGQLAASFKKMVVAIKAMITDADVLTEAAKEGNLTARADAEKHQGDFKKIVEGINNMMDNIVKPFHEFKKLLRNFCVNDFTQGVEGDYKNDIGEMAEAVDTMRERWINVKETFVLMAQGDFSRLPAFKEMGTRSEKDEFLPAVIGMMENIIAVLNEANTLSDAVVRGDLSVRSDATRFEGKYRELIEGINHIMDSMAKPLNEAVNVLDFMAENDYTEGIKGDYQGSFGELSQSVNKVITTLNQVMHEINTAAGQVAAGTKQVSDGSQALSQGATEQASSIEELTSSITEIAAQTRQNAANATEANQLATTASSAAAKGNTQMAGMLRSMEDINESSNNISRIIKVIDDIAFQTNILALNAAVEAARAGIHGKGFAVVAEEVRNLAAKSAEAAKETTAMIESSMKKVEEGSKIANETAAALNEILSSVEKAATLVGEIAVASNEQATGIAQVNSGIEQVAAVVQNNSATAEESAATTEELSGQAEMLKSMVGRFKLKAYSDESPAAVREAETQRSLQAQPVKAGGGFGKY